MRPALVDAGKIQSKLSLFREWDWTEYWTTHILEYENELILFYEAGVLVIDDSLQIKLHRSKYFNDFFVAPEGRTLKFLRDHEEEWFMPLTEDQGNEPKATA